jgi:hypothetical protein
MKTRLLIFFLAASFTGVAQKLNTENVFIITLDGFRWQELYTGADSALIYHKEYVKDPAALKSKFWHESPEKRREMLMPFFWSVIARDGQLYGNRKYNNHVDCSNQMWFSYPGYNEILCGYADDARIKSNDKFANPNVTVLEFLNRQPKYKDKVAAFGSWDAFPYIINEARSGIPVNAGFENASATNLSEREQFLNELQSEIPSPWPGIRLDGFTHHYALEYLKRFNPRVVYISYGETDDFAHDGKYDAYLNSARQTDKFIGDLWTWAQSQPQYRGKTNFIVTTDHGRGTVPVDTWRSHSAKISDSGQIWFAVIGPDTEPLGEMKQAGQYYQNQVAKTVASFLGVTYVSEQKVGEAVSPMIRK